MYSPQRVHVIPFHAVAAGTQSSSAKKSRSQMGRLALQARASAELSAMLPPSGNSKASWVYSQVRMIFLGPHLAWADGCVCARLRASVRVCARPRASAHIRARPNMSTRVRPRPPSSARVRARPRVSSHVRARPRGA